MNIEDNLKIRPVTAADELRLLMAEYIMSQRKLARAESRVRMLERTLYDAGIEVPA